MAYTPDLSFGASGDWFGHRDYTGNLKKIWDASSPGTDRQQKLMKARQDMLSWMGTTEGKAKIRDRKS